MTWLRYMQQRGTLNISRKLEQTIGLLTALYASVNSTKRVNFVDYMPFEASAKPQKELSQAEKIRALFNKIGTS